MLRKFIIFVEPTSVRESKRVPQFVLITDNVFARDLNTHRKSSGYYCRVSNQVGMRTKHNGDVHFIDGFVWTEWQLHLVK